MKKKFSKSLCIIIALVCITSIPIFAGTWKQNSSGWWYENDDKSYPVSKWQKIDGDWYYFYSNGEMATGWIQDSSNWYYLNSTGEMATGWIQDSSNWYYLNPTGEMVTGWIHDSRNWYFLHSTGEMATGWIQDSNNWYFLYSNGEMAYNTRIGEYVVGSDGAWEEPIIPKARVGIGYTNRTTLNNSGGSSAPTITAVTLSPSGNVTKAVGDNFDVSISGDVLQNVGLNTATLSVASDKTSVATVSAISGGKFTVNVVSAGSATITVTALYTGAQSVSATINLTVSEVIDEDFHGVYYISDSEGDDTNTGFSASSPWKTLNKVTQQTFQPGDKILFKAGDVWDTQKVRFNGSGSPEKPIIVDQYGSGNKPRFNGNGTTTKGVTYTHGELLFTNDNDTINTVSATVELWEGSYWTINNLEVTNKGKLEDSVRVGIALMDSSRNAAEYAATPSEYITIQNCYIHDVNSIFEIYAKRSGGIVIFGNYNNVTIDSNRIENVAVSGICNSAASQLAGSNPIYNLKNHIYSNNILKNIGGDGIVIRNVENGKIEYNWVDRACNIAGGAYAGIWTYSCKDTVIQYNEVSNTVHGGNDGQAFLVSSFNKNILIQYNYTHGNDRTIIAFTGRDNEVSTGTVFRYNVSINDSLSKNVSTTYLFGVINKDMAERTPLIYNNLIYQNDSLTTKNIFANYPPEKDIYDNIYFKLFNNIIIANPSIKFTNKFVSSGDIAYNLIMPSEILQTANIGATGTGVIHGNITSSGKLFIDIPLGKEPFGIITKKNTFNAEALSMFKPASDSPCIGAGIVIPQELLGSQARETTDFFGNRINPIEKVSIGIVN